MALNRQLLETRFQYHTGCTAQKAQHHTQRYLWLCGQEMLADHFSDDAGSRYYINATQLQNKLNTIQVNKERKYIWQVFQSFPERVFDIVQTGNNLNKELTMAQSRYTMEEVLLAAGTPEELALEVYAPYQADIRREDFDLVNIDMRSLENYIKSNVALDRDNPKTSPELLEEWDRNLKHAQKIWMLATASGGQLMQIRSNSKFGRRYYQGPNLQNTPKIVRHAALGQCHEYDIESSVFAWKLSWFRAICAEYGTQINMPATLEYLDHKSAIRRKLAQTVFDTTSDWAVNVIKEFITAIGFGAPARGVGYVANDRYQKPALAQIITAKTRLDRALADSWVQEFMTEQRNMNDAIIAVGKVTCIDEWRQVPELWEKGAKKLKPNSVISYLYQHAEREILDWAEQFCADYEVLLTVHDCIYTRRPVKLAEFRAGVKAFGDFFKLEHTAHRGYTWEDAVDISDPFYDPREQAVARRNQRYDSGAVPEHWNGSGYDGTTEYNIEDDPFFQSENNEIIVEE